MKLETEIRNMKRELRETEAALDRYRVRANRAEQEAKKCRVEAKEWERRFDIAMSKIPDVSDDFEVGTT